MFPPDEIVLQLDGYRPGLGVIVKLIKLLFYGQVKRTFEFPNLISFVDTLNLRGEVFFDPDGLK